MKAEKIEIVGYSGVSKVFNLIHSTYIAVSLILPGGGGCDRLYNGSQGLRRWPPTVGRNHQDFCILFS